MLDRLSPIIEHEPRTRRGFDPFSAVLTAISRREADQSAECVAEVLEGLSWAEKLRTTMVTIRAILLGLNAFACVVCARGMGRIMQVNDSRAIKAVRAFDR